MEENGNAKQCLSKSWGNVKLNLTEAEHRESERQCPPVWDGFTCWGPAVAGTTSSSMCPFFKGSDISKSAFRICDISGEWLDRDGFPGSVGWTNYTPCLTPEIREVMRRLGSNDDAQIKMNIAANTRILEFVGLSLSLAALLLSLLIFYYFRTLRNSRTRLHRHLFIAMVIQVAIRLIVYTDQAITRSGQQASGSQNSSYFEDSDSSIILTDSRPGLDNTPFLCEASYICLEYARTAMFMWMFVEGLFLHNMITVTVFEEKLSPLVYPLIGWILPIPLTVSWAIFTHLHYGAATCWWGYNFTLYFWILEGPRLAVLVINLAFLLNILRVLIMKLRQSNSSETQQALKAVKAALVLLPLLGLTNLLNMIAAPLEKSPLEFALWSYGTHLLTSTQGFILALLYCFRNGEVQIAVRKFVRIHIMGNSKHYMVAKKSIPMTEMQQGSVYRAGEEPLPGCHSQTVSLLNPATTQESTLIIMPTDSTPSSESSESKVPSSRFAQIKKTPFSLPLETGKVRAPAPLVVRTFSNGVLKQTSISRIQTSTEKPLVHRNSSGCSDDLGGKRHLLYKPQYAEQPGLPKSEPFVSLSPSSSKGQSTQQSGKSWQALFIPGHLLKKWNGEKKGKEGELAKVPKLQEMNRQPRSPKCGPAYGAVGVVAKEDEEDEGEQEISASTGTGDEEEARDAHILSDA